ncbi:hypothetical protein T4A_6967 [Trichinella pseudospiralis]|uniref:Uncharacterized protein n=1 Tax=Trichinella pseudospiralis TaxID=6337 RepID=A0A0V1DR69_TRIPS|nr:hypothetical protein T4A_6967 [Trichinella pseudospiralis]
MLPLRKANIEDGVFAIHLLQGKLCNTAVVSINGTLPLRC